MDDKHLKSTEKEYEMSGEAIGAGGMKTFYFEVIKEGLSELYFALAKPTAAARLHRVVTNY